MPPLARPRNRAIQLAGRHELELRRAIGNEIRRHREDAGISLRRLAAAAGISHGELWAIESGLISPSLEALTRIAGALGGRLAFRLDPGTGPIIRDHIQAALLQGLLPVVHSRWRKL